MEEEHQGSRTPASVGFTPHALRHPGERPSPAHRGVGAARDPDEPTRVAVLANLPTARVVEAGVLGTPPPSARPGDSDPGLVGVPASEPSTPAPAPATSGRALSADEIARRDAIRALAKAAAKHGIPLRQAETARSRRPRPNPSACVRFRRPRGTPRRTCRPRSVSPRGPSPIPTRAGARAPPGGGGGGDLPPGPGRLDRARGGRPLPRGKP